MSAEEKKDIRGEKKLPPSRRRKTMITSITKMRPTALRQSSDNLRQRKRRHCNIATGSKGPPDETDRVEILNASSNGLRKRRILAVLAGGKRGDR